MIWYGYFGFLSLSYSRNVFLRYRRGNGAKADFVLLQGLKMDYHHMPCAVQLGYAAVSLGNRWLDHIDRFRARQTMPAESPRRPAMPSFAYSSLASEEAYRIRHFCFLYRAYLLLAPN